MIGLGIGISLLTLALLSATFFEPVTEIPFGLDPSVTFFIQTIHDISTYMPWMDTIWNVFIIALGVKFTLFWVKWYIFALRFIRGGA